MVLVALHTEERLNLDVVKDLCDVNLTRLVFATQQAEAKSFIHLNQITIWIKDWKGEDIWVVWKHWFMS